jgi:rSAM/selenodomain-associated transferase 1
MPKSNTAYEILGARASRVGPNVCALAVMTKAPQAGQSKTRLVPPLTTAQAAMLSASFLRDTCENIVASCMNGTAAGVAVYTPVGAESFFDGLLPPSFSLLKQRGNLFGDRLFHATEDIFAAGYDSVCLIDSDSPTLPSRFLRAAVSALAQPRDQVVLGPAKDGGYYLIGLKKSHRHLFEDIDWSTSKVLTQTITRAKEIKLPVTLLASWFDVDDAATLRRLCDDLFPTNGKQAGPAYRAAHTRAYLARLLQTVHLWENLADLERPTAGESRRCDLRID